MREEGQLDGHLARVHVEEWLAILKPVHPSTAELEAICLRLPSRLLGRL